MRLILKNICYIFFYSPIALFLHLYFRVFNRLTIIGYKDYKKHCAALICANHISAIDSFEIGHIFFPRAVHFPAKQELFRNPLIGIIIGALNAFPVSRGYADLKLLKKISNNAKKKLVLIHPEGTRQSIEKLGHGKRAVGKIAHMGRLCIIPLYVRGTEQILPKGSIIPRLFKRVIINIGEPIDMEDLFDLPDNKDTSKLITKRIMDNLQMLKEQTEDYLLSK